MQTDAQPENPDRDTQPQSPGPAGTGNGAGPEPVSQLPAQAASIKPGDIVVDLAVGRGGNCFVARAQTGETGRVIGLDAVPEHLEHARQQADSTGFTNVEFAEGTVEAIPLANGQADVVVGDGALKRVADPQQAFDEVYRVLKPGGHCCLTDDVLAGTFPEAIREAVALYAGSAAAGMTEQLYLNMATMAGFEQVQVLQRQAVSLPNELLTTFLIADEMAALRESGAGLRRLLIRAEKPGDAVPDVFRTNGHSTNGHEPDEDDLDDLPTIDFLGRL